MKRNGIRILMLCALGHEVVSVHTTQCQLFVRGSLWVSIPYLDKCDFNCFFEWMNEKKAWTRLKYFI